MMCSCCTDVVKPAVESYFHANGFPVKVDDSKDGKGDPPAIASWIGRDVKKFLNEADRHLPVLLWFANVPDDTLTSLQGCASHRLLVCHVRVPACMCAHV